MLVTRQLLSALRYFIDWQFDWLIVIIISVSMMSYHFHLVNIMESVCVQWHSETLSDDENIK